MFDKILDKLADTALGWAFEHAKSWIVARWKGRPPEDLDYGADAVDTAATQFDMNDNQRKRLKMLDFKMEATSSELENYLDADGRKALRGESKAWKKLRDKKAEWAGLDWKGGSMEPFARTGTASGITVDRIKELEERLKDKRRNFDDQSDDEPQ